MASNIESYEANLPQRLEELRRGDPAYELHGDAICEALVLAGQLTESTARPERVVDVGCGLGFLTNKLAKIPWALAVGLDPSRKTISLARREHKTPRFYSASAESFHKSMKKFHEDPFHHAVLNMVLHSVDDDQADAIIQGTRKLLQPEGTILLVVPTQKWLMRKLIEHAQDKGMSRDEGVPWVHNQLRQRKVELPVRIRGGQYWPAPVTVYNRTIDNYAQLLQKNRFGVGVRTGVFGGPHEDEVVPFWEPRDYLNNYELVHRERSLLLSFALPDYAG